MIRPCNAMDVPVMLEIINDAARAYRGVIPADCWAEPYMPEDELRREIEDGGEFWGVEKEGQVGAVRG
ncbi:GNAT family N-acetyltransferase, partial [bacterium]|nr:GNAT family N-acetyltransferase [bacterium]